MNIINSQELGLTELSYCESIDKQGGLLLLYAWCIGSTALVCYGAFMAGYDAACK